MLMQKRQRTRNGLQAEPEFISEVQQLAKLETS